MATTPHLADFLFPNMGDAANEAAVIAERLPDWFRSLKPQGHYEEWLVTLAATASVKLQRCMLHEFHLSSYESRRASHTWDDDRRLEAEELGATLSKKPSRVRLRLLHTLQGAQWLSERWEALARVSAAGREWSAPQRNLALDLLGLAPELRDGLLPIDPAPGGSPAETQGALARSERAWLAERIESVLADRDDEDRTRAASGLTISFSPAMTKLRRHESRWSREFHRALAELRRAQRETSRVEPPPPPVAPAPEPYPDHASNETSEADTFEYERQLFAEEMARFEAEHRLQPAPAPVSAPAAEPTPSGNRRARRARLARQRASR